ncbi:MAG: hypothetical protein O9308_11120 [Beijerinckiaceae bacterium]|jgi:hypothetical protein|nr:hypothetical protein [Beijerinckiaceae bacterium]
MADIGRSAGMRRTLTVATTDPSTRPALQRRPVKDLQDQAAIGAPLDGFRPSGLSSQARDLFLLLDSLSEATRVIEAAGEGIDALLNLIDAAEALARQALRSASTAPSMTGAGMNATRSELAVRFDLLRSEIDRRAAGSGQRGINLLAGGSFTVRFGRGSAHSVTVTGVRFDAGGLGVKAACHRWQSDADIGEALSGLADARARLLSQSSALGSSLSAVRARKDVTQGVVDTSGACVDLPVLPLEDEEAARLMVLRARQQLAATALGLARQAEQGVLRLF